MNSNCNLLIMGGWSASGAGLVAWGVWSKLASTFVVAKARGGEF